ncbi:hypothetical protein HOP50_11g61850 [Chloropicon primus]|nr:hypothetical protein HOP50_11g61850 [Chloropicon primus]
MQGSRSVLVRRKGGLWGRTTTLSRVTNAVGRRPESLARRDSSIARAARDYPSDGGSEDYLSDGGAGDAGREELIRKLNASLDCGPEPMSGEELKGLIMERYGRLYDTRICKRRDGLGKMRLYLQVMWKYLGQRSFPMTEERYDEQLGAVAELISEWGCADQIRKEIIECEKNPILDTTGANAVMIALDVQDGMMDEFF